MRTKRQFSKSMLEKLPAHGYLYQFYKPLKITRQSMNDWIIGSDLPVHRTKAGYRIIVRAEFMQWLEREGRISE